MYTSYTWNIGPTPPTQDVLLFLTSKRRALKFHVHSTTLELEISHGEPIGEGFHVLKINEMCIFMDWCMEIISGKTLMWELPSGSSHMRAHMWQLP